MISQVYKILLDSMKKTKTMKKKKERKQGAQINKEIKPFFPLISYPKATHFPCHLLNNSEQNKLATSYLLSKCYLHSHFY